MILFLVTSCLAVVVQPCMESIPVNFPVFFPYTVFHCCTLPLFIVVYKTESAIPEKWGRGVEDMLSWTPWNFRFFYFTPGNSRQNKASSLETPLDPFMQKLLFDKNHWFQLLSTKNYWSISLFLISIILHISQPFHHVCCWQRNKMAFDVVRWKLYCYSSPSHLTQENFVSPSTSFLSFFLSFFLPFSFFGLLRSLLQICHQIHQKVLTKSP